MVQKIARLKTQKVMAKLFFYHDTRSGKGEFPIKIRIQHNKEKSYINTGVKVTPECWIEEDGVIIGHPKSKTFNALLGSKMQSAAAIVKDLELTGRIKRFNAKQLKEIIENNGEVIEDVPRHNFKDFYMKCIESKKKPSTKSSYQQALNNLERFDPMLEDRCFEDIDLAYLQRLDKWFEEREVTVNSRAVYYRNMKSVFNDAINAELTTAYPFRKFKIKKTPTKKRNLSVEELRLLKDYPIQDKFQQKYRDMFMLMFYLRGINAADLFRLKESDIRLGRLNYIRAKTGKPYSVKIEPEARAIMDRYKGKDYIIDVCDGAKTQAEIDVKYKGFLKRMGRGLKKIGTYKVVGRGGKRELSPILPFISQYWCRHTSATLMAKLGYSNEIIATSLGHEYGNKTTNIYIEYNENEVDKANRALIDFVNEK